MKVGLINAIRNHPERPRPLQEVYADFIGDAVLAEELGMDFAWYGEHHFRPCQWTGSPLVICAAVAAKTRKIRIGTSVICLPFHNPLRLAEDAVAVDILSGGRLDLGVGVGSQFEEFESFGISPKEMNSRSWETMDIIERCFGDEKIFSHKGQHFDFPNVTFTSKPVQKRVPIWWGGFGPKNLARAARKGYHLLAAGSDVYDPALREAGRNPDDYCIAPMQQACVAETENAAWQAYLDGLHYFVNFYMLRRQLDGSATPRSAEITKEMIRGGALKLGSGPFQAVAGTPDQVKAHFMAIGEGAVGRVTHLPIAFRQPGMETRDVHRSMRLFASEILPSLR